ncbi:Hypothetical predicted protein [Cloeon dipterum]|uniref:Gustatory receptor n=1 Tax=Cloeon dipterum TaxID=197152 RepID=A0A8S1C9V4_9INSE|nr:Hypothetical predicted protein [Cloeon dipterum]
MLLDAYPCLRMVHADIFHLIRDTNKFFGPLLILTQMLQFQVLLYSGYVFVIACFDLEDAFAKAQETVSKLLSVETDTSNVWVREEAALFREQLLHYRTFTFNISGLCTINNAYIFIVFGALATYLATLLQFHLLALQFKQDTSA